MPRPCAQRSMSGNSASLKPLSATALSLILRPARSAASMPVITRERSPHRVIARNLSGSSVSTDTLMRLTPQSASSSAKRASCDPLVVRVSSSSAPLSRWRESWRTRCMMFLRTSGSPPVSLSLRTPFSTKTVHSRSSSSRLSRSRFGRNVMSSAMQYVQRKSQRSVTDTRRYEIARPKGSIMVPVLSICLLGLLVRPVMPSMSAADASVSTPAIRRGQPAGNRPRRQRSFNHPCATARPRRRKAGVRARGRPIGRARRPECPRCAAPCGRRGSPIPAACRRRPV